MCFSATASFTVSSALIASGVVALKMAPNSKALPFAAIPLIFGIQQFIEGVLWLSFVDINYMSWQNSATHMFIFIAQVVWPLWVPFAIWMMEEDAKRKQIIQSILYVGILVSLYLAYSLFEYEVSSSTREYHIHYELLYPINVKYTGIFYFIPTVIPAIISSVKRMWVIGTVNLLSFIVTKFYFEEYVVSVWCFFAAALSILVFFVLQHLKQREANTLK
jgi:hypothetical protein